MLYQDHGLNEEMKKPQTEPDIITWELNRRPSEGTRIKVSQLRKDLKRKTEEDDDDANELPHIEK